MTEASRAELRADLLSRIPSWYSPWLHLAFPAVAGIALCAFALAEPFATLAQLDGQSHHYAISYMRLLGLAMPFSMLMFTANACLRGAGDTLTPAISMIVVDAVNIFFSYALTYGALGMPNMGFNGIAAGMRNTG